LAERIPPPGTSAEGAGQGRHRRVLAESKFISTPSLLITTIARPSSAMIAKTVFIAVGGSP